jgi:hypothetical protein
MSGQPVNPMLRQIFERVEANYKALEDRAVSKPYYPYYSVYIRTYQKFIYKLLNKESGINLDNADVVYDIVGDIAVKTNHVWPESHKKINQLLDQYVYMSVYGWVYLIYSFITDMYTHIINSVTCGSELNFSHIVDVLINNINFRWKLPMAQIDLISKPPEPRSWSNRKVKLFNNRKKTVLSFMSANS